MTSVRRTRRWRGIAAVALAAAAVGIVGGRPSVLLLSVVGVAFAAYPELGTAPRVALDLERSLDEESPAHGDEVTVTVRLRNVGETTLRDLRIIDGVPPMLEVTGGTPRHAASLRPGKATSFTYTVRAAQGLHRFEPATVLARDLPGTTEVETEVDAETTIECIAEVEDVPLRKQTHHFVGEITTDEGGSGVEFHQTRDYNPGDALGRIDWRRFAKTGDLSSVEYREERGAAVVLCLDARAPAYRTTGPDEPHGVAYALTATRQLLEELATSNHTVGLTSLADREACWLATGTGADHLNRARERFRRHPSFSLFPPGEADPDRWAEQLTTLRTRLKNETQVVLLSPLTDRYVVEAALTLEAAGHAVSVISPDVSTDATIGGELSRAKRTNHIYSLRSSGVRVVDWPPEEPLGAVLMRTEGVVA